MVDVIIDALIDSAKTLPFLLLIYVLMEVIENARKKEKIEKALVGVGAPVAAGFLGIIPECGFSVMCAKLFDKGLIKIGTLIAAFIAVSDEGLIVMISTGVSARDIFVFLGIKIFYAICIGEILNLVLSGINQHTCPRDGDCIECGEHHSKPIDKYLFHPLLHTLKTFIYVLVFNFIFGLIIYYIGEKNFDNFMSNSSWLQPLIAPLVGLIPNCASSMLLAEAYVNGILNYAGLIGGLSANAGIGLLILFKNRKHLKINLLIVGIMYVSGVMIGYLCVLFGL